MTLDRLLFEQYWHLGCHRRELANDGDFVKFDGVLGEVVLFNDNGEIVAFDNTCPHRGARIYSDAHGNRPATCSYHGWTYKHGTIIVPEKERFKSCELDRARFNTFQVDWCGDFVFFAIKPRSGLYEQLGRTAELLENISFNVDQRLDLNRYNYECYWPLAVENALEPYHIAAVHSETLATLELGDGENVFDEMNSIWYAPLGNTRLANQLARLRKLFNIDYQYGGYMSIYIFPFTMISSTYGYSYSLQNFFPAAQGQGLTHFTSRLYASNTLNDNAARMLDTFFESTVRMNRKVFEEDHEICKLLPKESWSTNALRFPSDAEVKIDHFRQSCRAVGETSEAVLHQIQTSIDEATSLQATSTVD
ncbi:ring hydroxylating alpha subunit family protein [Paraburkholderia xenovorans LB400]|jgi:phenylpropionate dioxygenase-like ring-hydroxylating dioxygenase large terminal subunit|uniref:Benzoate 1,2-dioxygenase alpha subunit n=1 Tax=Paraburkholderia xenovorans (strain LB400) TaxID=266265 RepID=Q13SV1_PARXL|nr:Rieske 2Fe-2S domain-containing protein [Paraburkholderia xenovorans]ABE32838.1 putative benzoate 1,2-dioxygenase alpha subunit [Paraburkholderia xenovorans LB400]AIP33633.1 ring hydroxylating alpha subunit family protein [Paraburkholderia xenovorans LB400]NPT33011.1 Rieske 2Fe-2S domain-containing protein [Paraburkholderia xenovorans]